MKKNLNYKKYYNDRFFNSLVYTLAGFANDELLTVQDLIDAVELAIEKHRQRQIFLNEPIQQDPKWHPKVVCLCGSTRFKDAFDEANYQATMAGNIVLSVGFFMHATGNKHGESIGATPEQKLALDELHKRKIDIADEIFVLNVGGYIGDSTRSEVEYAVAHRKPVRYLEPVCTWYYHHSGRAGYEWWTADCGAQKAVRPENNKCDCGKAIVISKLAQPEAMTMRLEFSTAKDTESLLDEKGVDAEELLQYRKRQLVRGLKDLFGMDLIRTTCISESELVAMQKSEAVAKIVNIGPSETNEC